MAAGANGTVDIQEKFGQFHTQVDRFMGSLTFKNVDEAQATLDSFSKQFKEFHDLEQMPPGDPTRRKYSLVRNLLSTDIPSRIKRLTQAKPPRLDVHLESDETNDRTPSSMNNVSPRHQEPDPISRKSCCIIF